MADHDRRLRHPHHRDSRRRVARPGDRRAGAAAAPGHDVSPRHGGERRGDLRRREGGVRLHALGQPDRGRVRAQGRGPRTRRGRPGHGERHGGHRVGDPHRRESRRSHRLGERHLPEHVPPDGDPARVARHRDDLRRRDRPGQRRARRIRPQTKLIYLETPGNPLLTLCDLEAIGAIARRAGVTTICDNTFASPVNQRPLDLGIDVGRAQRHEVLLRARRRRGRPGRGAQGLHRALPDRAAPLLRRHHGAVHAYLMLRGTVTLPLRVERHNANALRAGRLARTASGGRPRELPRPALTSAARAREAADAGRVRRHGVFRPEGRRRGGRPPDERRARCVRWP